MARKYNSILFDLDGTLIDSVNGIESSFKYAFYNTYGKDLTQSIRSLIGPPIDQVLLKLNGENDLFTINKFLRFFKEHYDIIGFKESVLFSGVDHTLKILTENGARLFIATNKRYLPTQKILSWLKIEEYFEGIYCSDFPITKFSSKTEMLGSLIIDHCLIREEILMIGDTIHDSDAAINNNLNFVFVEYGYGICQNPTHSIKNIKQLINIIA
jgi:phosphoglycolate phosphatase